MRRLLLCAVCAVLVGCSEDAGSDSAWWPDASDASDASADSDGSGPEGGSDGADPGDAATQDGDAGDVDAANPTDAAEEADGSEPVVTVAVSHSRELRGAWVATVSRLNWPSSSTASAQKAQMDSILDAVEEAGLNTVFFQVRPEADALYASDLEPWSRYLTGTQGVDPGYDPLTYTIEACHRRGLELHAWLNPYRARAGDVGESAPNHVIHQMPQAVVSYGSLRWLDPGHPDAFEHTLSVIEDLLTRYDLDGLHFDDYFYPYPQDGLSFDDDDTFAAYGGGMTRADWRRDNVNRMVAAVGESVRTLRGDVRWGISPFGIYRPGMPPGVVGLDQYESLYADPLKWMEEGWLEYVAPQLYWPTTSSGQPYESLLAWWDARAVETGRMLLVGNSAANDYGLDEYRAEMDAVRAAGVGATRGAIWWSVDPIVDNAGGLATMLASEYFARPAATPKLLDALDTPPSHPSVTMDQGGASITSSPEGIRFWAVYRQTAGGWEVERLVPSGTTAFSLPDGTWAISAIDRSGRESVGVVVEGQGSADAGPSGASCAHTYGGVYAHGGCSPSYQCCDGQWLARGACGGCTCEEATGEIGCSP